MDTMHELTKYMMKLAGFEKERINEFENEDLDDYDEEDED